MNLGQFAVLAARVGGACGPVYVRQYFERCATTGDDAFTSPREAQRVAAWCDRLVAAAPRVVGTNTDLAYEAEVVAANARRYVATAFGPGPDLLDAVGEARAKRARG